MPTSNLAARRGIDSPSGWRFPEVDAELHARYSWRFPAMLVAGGTWAAIWRAERGGGAAASLLPVLALHTWPGRKGDADPAWTAWQHLGRDKAAALAGIARDSLRAGLAHLEALGLLEVRDGPRGGRNRRGRPRLEYRLRAGLYVKPDEPFRVLSAQLFYGGFWRLLPRASARQLLVTLLALDPVADEASAFAEDARARRAPALVDLADGSGLSMTALKEAVAILMAPTFKSEGQPSYGFASRIETGRGPAYHIVRAALSWLYLEPGVSLFGEALHAERWRKWPGYRVPKRRRAPRRRAA